MIDDRINRKYVFVCGLQRSGTSVLARNLGKLENCTAFKNTGAIEDEGQYLQDIYPTNNQLGGTGWYGFDPRAHLTEASDLLTPESAAQLRASWHSHWDATKTICLEKTPGNLLMTRFLQAAFPNSYFVVVRRHPVSVSMANQRWKKTTASLHRGFEHWLQCYGLFETDRKYLKHVYELRYEDYIQDAPKYHHEIAAFVGTRVADEKMEDVTGVHNKRYLDRWCQLLASSPFRGYYQYVATKYEPRFSVFGYSLLQSDDGVRGFTGASSDLSDRIGKVYCHGADAHAFLRRLAERTRGVTRRQIRKVVPDVIRKRIKRFVEDKSLA